MDIVYSKISNERDSRHNVVTCILEDNGKFSVIKRAENIKSNEFTKNLAKISEILTDKCSGTVMKPVRSRLVESEENDSRTVISMDYVSGEALDRLIDDALKSGNEKLFFELLGQYRDLISKIYSGERFDDSDEFKATFGNIEVSGEVKAARYLDIDLIPQNILIDQLENWNVIDYEWTFDFLIPIKFLFYRAICYTFKSDFEVHAFNVDIYDWMGISNDEKIIFRNMEDHFQRKFLNNKESNLEYINAVLNECNKLQDISLIDIIRKLDSPKVYEDQGMGYSEDSAFYPYFEKVGHVYRVVINDALNVRRLRLDPAEVECLFKVEKIVGIAPDGSEVKLDFDYNGAELEKDIILFGDKDPNISISTEGKFVSVIIEYKIAGIAENDDAVSIETMLMAIKRRREENDKLKNENEMLKKNTNQIIADKDKIIEEQNAKIAEIHNSKSWKVVNGIRKFLRIIRNRRD